MLPENQLYCIEKNTIILRVFIKNFDRNRRFYREVVCKPLNIQCVTQNFCIFNWRFEAVPVGWAQNHFIMIKLTCCKFCYISKSFSVNLWFLSVQVRKTYVFHINMSQMEDRLRTLWTCSLLQKCLWNRIGHIQ